MEVKYIENGRFDRAIWVDQPETLAAYSQYQALSIGVALDLWMGLTKALAQAGQLGTLDAGMKEALSAKP